ncbi:MAG: response regulator [Spirochaetota bacterium]|jgi:putative two-component system response regulator|nr:response regulator [Spirochaetota bacterium]
METIFVVDDNDVNLVKAKQALSGRYRVLTLPSAVKMFELFEKMIPDLILLDIDMPDMDGFAAMQKLMEDVRTARIPVIFLTASNDEAAEARGLELGAVDYVTKPFSTPVLLNRIAMHLHIDGIIRQRTMEVSQLKAVIVSSLADIVERRDHLTGGHIERTTQYLRLMVEGMLSRGVYAEQMKGWDVDLLVSSAQMHDVGKIEIPDLILNKPGKLTPEEFEIMQTHTSKGEQFIDQIIAQASEVEFLRHAKLFAGYHHERWDGKGYPRGLAGEEIPLEGRIMAIADVYDALVSRRPYKEPFSSEYAAKIILENAGALFDPALAAVFLDIQDAFAAAAAKYHAVEAGI